MQAKIRDHVLSSLGFILADGFKVEHGSSDHLAARIPDTAPRQVEDLDRYLSLLISDDRNDLAIHGIAEMRLGLVFARIEQEPRLSLQIVSGPHGAGPFIFKRK